MPAASSIPHLSRPLVVLALLALSLASSGCSLWRHTQTLSLTTPSNHRDWPPSLATLATAQIEGSEVKIHNIRNCRYLAEDEYVLDHYDKTFDLSKLTSVDFVVVPFKEAPSLAHTMLSFGFEDRDYVVVSVEARLEKGETYSPFLGAAQQYELMYVVGDERDLIQLRTEQRDVDVYVYRAQVQPVQVQALFVDMLERANKLARKPEFYDSFTNNCTTNIVDHVNKLDPNLLRYTYQVLLPGHSDRLAYDLGLLDRSVSFEQLKLRAHVNTRAHAFADRSDFSQQIRR